MDVRLGLVLAWRLGLAIGFSRCASIGLALRFGVIMLALVLGYRVRLKCHSMCLNKS